MVRLLQIAAAALLLAAAFLWWRGDNETAFILFVVGSCALFVSVRFAARSRVHARQAAESHEVADQPEPE